MFNLIIFNTMVNGVNIGGLQGFPYLCIFLVVSRKIVYGITYQTKNPVGTEIDRAY